MGDYKNDFENDPRWLSLKREDQNFQEQIPRLFIRYHTLFVGISTGLFTYAALYLNQCNSFRIPIIILVSITILFDLISLKIDHELLMDLRLENNRQAIALECGNEEKYKEFSNEKRSKSFKIYRWLNKYIFDRIPLFTLILSITLTILSFFEF